MPATFEETFFSNLKYTSEGTVSECSIATPLNLILKLNNENEQYRTD